MKIIRKLILRPYIPNDTKAIIALFKETVHSVGARYYTPEQVAVWAPIKEQTPEEIAAELTRWQAKLESYITYVVECEDKLVGFIDMSKEGYLDHMYVHKDYQASGASVLLINAIEKSARELGLNKITTHASKAAVLVAKRRGFVVLTEQTVVLNGVELTNYVMEKTL